MLTENINIIPNNAACHKVQFKILVVEDDPIFQKHSLKVLEFFNCDVDLATHGKAALRCCNRNAYDIILMDYELPDMQGVQVSKQILQLPSYKKRPSCIVGLTSHLPLEVKMQCMEAGMIDVISKPINRQLVRGIAKISGIDLVSR